MKSLSIAAFLILVLGSAVHADQGVSNVFPTLVFTCRELQEGALVLDGAKTLTLRRDQSGETTLTVVQKDQFGGDIALIENLPLTQKICQAFLPCEIYESDQGATRFFVNFLSSTGPLDGHLTSAVTGSVDFDCTKK